MTNYDDLMQYIYVQEHNHKAPDYIDPVPGFPLPKMYRGQGEAIEELKKNPSALICSSYWCREDSHVPDDDSGYSNPHHRTTESFCRNKWVHTEGIQFSLGRQNILATTHPVLLRHPAIRKIDVVAQTSMILASPNIMAAPRRTARYSVMKNNG